MIFRQHIPGPPLAEYVAWFWFYADWVPDHSREHVLPDGTFELIINLQEQPRKLFDREDAARYTSFRRGWLSGAHSEYLVIDALPASSMMAIRTPVPCPTDPGFRAAGGSGLEDIWCDASVMP